MKLSQEDRRFEMDVIGIDVVIVTKDRYRQLLKCVNHICINSLKPKNLIIVDSSKSFNRNVSNEISILAKKVGIKLRYNKIPDKGVGYSRNLGLRNVESSYFAFIDDDEYVPKFWLDRVSKLLSSKKDIQVFAGPKIPGDNKNYWHRVMRSLVEHEFNYVGNVDSIPSGNSIYLTSFIKRHRLNFDERFRQCSEDQAFSYELRKLKTNIFFDKSIWVKHDLRRELTSFVKQWFYYGVNKLLYQRLYLGGGNILTTFPYIGKLGDISIWPGVAILNLAFLFGYIYASLKSSFLYD